MKNDSKFRLLNLKILCLLLLLIFSRCKTDRQEELGKGQEVAEQPPIVVPDFNADSAFAFIQKQVDFGPRIPNSTAHSHAGLYLIDKLKQYNAMVEVQEFQEAAYNGNTLNLKNIIAIFNSDKKKRILLASHWDTRPFADKESDNPKETFDGANDGASGVGVLLEIARILSTETPAHVGIDIIFFDGEDFGEPEFYDGQATRSGKIYWCLGSQYWSRNKHRKNYIAYYGILLDMVGARGAMFYKEGGSMQYAKKIVNKVWEAGRTIGFDHYFINQTSPGITDDHIFVNRDAKIPMINIVEYDPESPDSYFGSYHHTTQDNLTLLDTKTLKAVGQTVLYVIFNE